MKDKIFLDTNIFVYNFDENDSFKRQRSIEIVSSALSSDNYYTSYQVIQEFTNVASRKFAVPLKKPDLQTYLKSVLFPLCRVHYSHENILKATEIQQKHKLSFYDSLIVSSALECKCNVLYSEDLGDGDKIQTLEIRNPFKVKTGKGRKEL
ncbi:PIN domain-containing protein [Leptospira idonii]|uniref:PIN domain-containing protein n=1 Tax=Leptospira idonii TaxID=1193500 RepID=A0A4R9M2Q1_9LEPT|nr:PIN domain-containing protein [Leptospira idonii]TGN20261.1 PIN domain-containing protein [Leptospira idonii]